MGGGFDTEDAFGPGQLAEVNMWSRVLSGSEIAAQYQDCHIPQGSVHAWSQFKDAINGTDPDPDPIYQGHPTGNFCYSCGNTVLNYVSF